MKKKVTEIQQPPNVAGRIDVLLIGIIERVVERSGNPVAKVMYEQYGEEINGTIEKYFAPRTKAGRVKRILRTRKKVAA